MQFTRFSDFSSLYRAAFAEPNPDMKQLLLSDVKRALDRWAATVSDGMAPQKEMLREERRVA